MVWVQLLLVAFFAWRAFGYFTNGRPFAMVVAGLASLLFITSSVVSALPPG